MLTPDQIQQLKYSANNGGLPAGSANASMNDAQYEAWKTGSINTPQTPSYTSDVADQLTAGGNKIVSSVQHSADRLSEDQLSGDTSLGGELRKTAHVLEGGLGTAAGAVQTLFSPLSALFQKAADTTGVHPFDALMSTPGGKALAAWAQMHPEAATNLQDALTVASTIGGGEGASAAAPAIKDGVSTIADDVTSALKPTEVAPEVKAAADQARTTAAQTKASAAIDSEVRDAAAKYPTIGRVLNDSEVTRGTDPIGVLGSYPEGKALPTLKGGKYQPDAAVSYLKGQVARLSALKDKLVDTGKDVTPVEDFQARANAIIDGQGWSLAKKADAKADVQKLTDGWKQTYPDGIPNGELDSLKTEHTNESTSYTSKSPFSLDAHAIVGKTARQLVESNAGDAPIAELNKLISSHYDAIKLLGAMRGKAPHGGALSRMMNNTIGEVGGLAGGMAVGHPFLGAMVGRAGAEAVNDIINNHFISNPLKRALVNSMKGTDPAVVQRALDFLDSSAQQTESTPPATPQIPQSPE